MYKKADAGLTILIVIIIIIFIGWLVSYGGRDCRTDSDCKEHQYCGSDFSCHDMKIVTQTVVEHHYGFPAVFIGLSIVAAAIIVRWKRG